VDGKQFFVDEERLLGRWCAKDDVYHSGRAENDAMQKLVKASLKNQEGKSSSLSSSISESFVKTTY